MTFSRAMTGYWILSSRCHRSSPTALPVSILFCLCVVFTSHTNLLMQLRRHQYASSSDQRTTRCNFPLRPLLDVITLLQRHFFLNETACARRYLLHFPCLRRHRRLCKAQKGRRRNQK